MPAYLSSALNALGFSPCCLLCQQSLPHYQRICIECSQILPFVENACSLCARDLPDGQSVCGHCQQSALPYDRLYVALDYIFPVDQLVLGGKFSQKLQNLTLLAELFMERCKIEASNLPEVLIPVPLHAKRLRERGYNQALELAKVLGKKWQIPVMTCAVRRLNASPAQTSLSAQQRRANVAHAFSVYADIKGKHLAIVDDVLTTGSTVQAMSSALHLAGAKRIDIYCMTRSI